MEPDIRAADRDMREIEVLEKKGVTGAGKLPGSCTPSTGRHDYNAPRSTEYEHLQPRLDTLLKAHHEDLLLAASLEKRIATLMERHVTHVRLHIPPPSRYS